MRQRIEQQLSHDLPIGTSFDDVKSYLEKSKTEYDWDENSNAFYGIIRDVKKRWPVSESIQVTLQMDDKKNLKSIEVKSIFTGP